MVTRVEPKGQRTLKGEPGEMRSGYRPRPIIDI